MLHGNVTLGDRGYGVNLHGIQQSVNRVAAVVSTTGNFATQG